MKIIGIDRPPSRQRGIEDVNFYVKSESIAPLSGGFPSNFPEDNRGDRPN
ncbi:hypothetical protein JJD41_03505 [Oxynema sp. CENA135]|nr:hypothetical protein [Oxynema sp. CENA135]